VVDVLFWASVAEPPEPVGASDAAHSQLIPVSEALQSEFHLAFDHPIVLRDAVTAAGL
jgi:hypothetical protein